MNKRLSKGQLLFISSLIQLLKKIYQNSDEEVNALLQDQDANLKGLLIDIGQILLRYKIIDSLLNMTEDEKAKEKKKFNKKLKNVLGQELKDELKVAQNTIKKSALDRWGINSYLFSFETDFTLKKLDRKKLDKIILSKIDGKDYSDRMKNNKLKIVNILQSTIGDFLDGKISVNDIEKQIRKVYDANSFNVERLVNHEISRVQNEVNEVWFKDHDVEWLLYDATLDNKTCKDCRPYDGKSYRRDDRSRPKLPRHISCRCTYTAIPNKDWRPRYRLDNGKNEVISYKNFEAWANENEGVI